MVVPADAPPMPNDRAARDIRRDGAVGQVGSGPGLERLAGEAQQRAAGAGDLDVAVHPELEAGAASAAERLGDRAGQVIVGARQSDPQLDGVGARTAGGHSRPFDVIWRPRKFSAPLARVTGGPKDDGPVTAIAVDEVTIALLPTRPAPTASKPPLVRRPIARQADADHERGNAGRVGAVAGHRGPAIDAENVGRRSHRAARGNIGRRAEQPNDRDRVGRLELDVADRDALARGQPIAQGRRPRRTRGRWY